MKPPTKSVVVFRDSAELESAISSHDKEVLSSVASSTGLNEELALAFLKRLDLPYQSLDALARNSRAMKSRKVKNEVVKHPRTPRHVALPLMRQMYTFELMQAALTPTVAADLKLAIEDALISRVATLTAGERLTLAKRSSARVVAALLNDTDPRVIEAGLDNPYLTEIHIVKALLISKPSQLLAADVCHHRKWSTRKDVQAVLLRNEYTPLAQAIKFSHPLSKVALKDLLAQSKLPEKIKDYLLEMAEKRKR
ncbi:MAG TPA: hypothetical protein VM056_00985 [Terriglobales bacterium]|nr:hypothetical protein [Terriglobales bacterium]